MVLLFIFIFVILNNVVNFIGWMENFLLLFKVKRNDGLRSLLMNLVIDDKKSLVI